MRKYCLMRILRFLPLIVVATLMAMGCAATSPLVGVWSGTPKVTQSSNPMAGMAAAMLGMGMKGECTLTLKADGTGFLKVPIAPERAIAWSEEDGKVILRPRDEDKGVAETGKSAATGSGSTVGTLSADKQQLDLDLGILKIAFKKKPDAK